MTIYALDGVAPDIAKTGDVFVAEDAVLVGNVVLGPASSVWFGAKLRGDNEVIEIGAGSNVQEDCVMHTDMGFPLRVGRDCTIGHRAILHGCTIGDGSLVGMGATVLNGAIIGKGCLIGAGALIPEGKTIPDGSLVMGMPGRVVRELTVEERDGLSESAARYQANGMRFLRGMKAI